MLKNVIESKHSFLDSSNSALGLDTVWMCEIVYEGFPIAPEGDKTLRSCAYVFRNWCHTNRIVQCFRWNLLAFSRISSINWEGRTAHLHSRHSDVCFIRLFLFVLEDGSRWNTRGIGIKVLVSHQFLCNHQIQLKDSVWMTRKFLCETLMSNYKSHWRGYISSIF